MISCSASFFPKVWRVLAYSVEASKQALARADLSGFAERRRQSEQSGRLRGLGFAYHIKGTGGAPSENVDIRFEPDGALSLITGTQHIGQGHTDGSRCRVQIFLSLADIGPLALGDIHVALI